MDATVWITLAGPASPVAASGIGCRAWLGALKRTPQEVRRQFGIWVRLVHDSPGHLCTFDSADAAYFMLSTSRVSCQLLKGSSMSTTASKAVTST